MSDAPRQLPPKKEVALTLLEGPSLFVHLDPRRTSVLVPKGFLGQSQLVLQIGLNMNIPIPDLNLDDEGITCTLSFNRAPFWCRLPWDAIYALVGEDGRGMVWPDDVPPEVAQQMQRQQAAAKPSPGKRGRAKLAAVESGDDEAAPRRRSREEPKPSSKEPKRLEAVASRPQRVPAAAPSDEEASKPSSSPNAPDTPARQPSPAAGKKPKRELPPYLRVIK
jgi:stringent starvation protein B